MSDECMACKVSRYPSSVAFLAGVAFACQHNNNTAIRRQLCTEHWCAIVKAASVARSDVPEADRRQP